jgi:phenylalanyl-tRNA synthetase beta chain
MVVSLNWLKEYVKLDDNITIQEIIDRLTMSGSKVETFEEFGKRTENVFTAVVENIEEHKNDKTLKVLSINTGSKVYKAVAKIPDIEVGDIIPLALPGAKVIGKEIKVSEVEGVKSECMVCHILDLGLDQKTFPWVKPSGLISFPKDVKIGQDVNDILGLGDYIIEFEITPNRSDCLSVEGLAKELAVTFGKECKDVWQYKVPEFKKVDNVDSITVKIDSANCKRYTMNVAHDINIKQSSYDMQLKLIKSGIRPINNIVDITNYVMLEIGQPLHAFDREAIKTNSIVVSQANDEEKITTLDGIERNLISADLVITDSNVPLAIAGVMGGLDSGIKETTKDVVLESANFVRGSVRNTSKRQLLRTDASSRYEKGLPTDLTIYAMNRVCNLINSTNSGKVENAVVDIYPVEQEKHIIDLNYAKINSVIGTNIFDKEIDNILNSIGLKIENGKVHVPYFREDLEIIEDLAEEVARIYGYDRLESKLPDTSLTFGGKNKIQQMQDKCKEIALAKGFNEIYTYTFFSKETLKRMCINEESKMFNLLKVSNPLSQEFEYMRTTTMPLMLEALERNYTRKNEKARLFEMGKTFSNPQNIEKGKLVDEELVLTFGMYDQNSDFYDLKQVIESVLNYFNILNENYDLERIIDRDEYHPGISARIVLNDEIIAEFGKLSPIVQNNYILPKNTYIASIYFNKIIKYANQEKKFVELPKYPAVERDIAFIIDDRVLSFDIEKKFKNIENVEKVNLFDVYQGKQIEEGKKSMAYRLILRSKDRTLDEKDITKTMNQIIECLKNDFNTEIRS